MDRGRGVERCAACCAHRAWRTARAGAAERRCSDPYPLWHRVRGALGKRDDTVTLLLGVCTTRAGQTSTSWATSLAWSLAASRSVVLVDCDMEGGTIADLLYLRLDDRGLANCFGDRPVTATVLGCPDDPGAGPAGSARDPGAAQHLWPGDRRLSSFDCAGTRARLHVTRSSSISGIRGRTRASDPRGPLPTRCAPCFDRVFIVIRDDPALLSQEHRRPSHRATSARRVDRVRAARCDPSAGHGREPRARASRSSNPARVGVGRATRRSRRRHGSSDDPRRRRSGVASVSAACRWTRLRSPAVTGSSVQVSRWPHIPTEEREVAEIIAASVQRSRNGEPASVLHEERLGEDVSTAIDRAIESPQIQRAAALGGRRARSQSALPGDHSTKRGHSRIASLSAVAPDLRSGAREHHLSRPRPLAGEHGRTEALADRGQPVLER